MKALQDELGILTDIAAMRRLIAPNEALHKEQDLKTATALSRAETLWHERVDAGEWWRRMGLGCSLRHPAS
jgi:hypothetical protein